MSDGTLLRGFGLAIAGRHAEAERLLLEDSSVAQSTLGLDLLARIRMEQGDEEEARRLWGTVLEREPGHAGAAAALKALSGQWWREQRVREWTIRAVAVAGVVALAVGAWVLGLASRSPADSKAGSFGIAKEQPAEEGAAGEESERIVTIDSPPTEQRLVAARQKLALVDGDRLVAAVARSEDVDSDSLEKAFQRSIALVAAFSEVAGFPAERTLVAACTNVAPPYAILRVLRDKPEDEP